MIRNKLRKGVLSLVLTLLFWINFSALASAEEASTDEVDNVSLFSISREDMSQEQIELYEKLLSQNQLQEGDVIVLYQTEDEILYAEVTDSSSKMTRGAEVTSQTFLLSRSILGFTQDLLSLTVKCNWISDGVNSKIIDFGGTYKKFALGVSCSWNSNYEVKGDLMWVLSLDYSYGSTTGYINTAAAIRGDFETGDSMSLSISFDPH